MTFFTANDFEIMDVWHSDTLAKFCNDKLAREAKVVYGFYDGKKYEAFGCRMEAHESSHRALLICVEEIERKPCEHEPKVYSTRIVCAKCDKEIKPVCWGVVDEQR